MRISDWSSDVCSSDLYYDHQFDQGKAACDTAHYHSPRSICAPGCQCELGFRRFSTWNSKQGSGQPHGLQVIAVRKRDVCLEQSACRQSGRPRIRSEEHTSELQSLMRISYAVFCLKKKNNKTNSTTD